MVEIKNFEETGYRYVNTEQICKMYSLKYVAVKAVAKECGALLKLRGKSVINITKFDAYIRSIFEEDDELKRKENMDDPKLCEQVNLGNKKYVRYEEAQYLYSMGKKKLYNLAKEAKAVRKIGGVSLVSIEKLNNYIESNYAKEDE